MPGVDTVVQGEAVKFKGRLRGGKNRSATGRREVINPALFEAFSYMPVTRDLSEGKRRLLRRWCDRQANGGP